MGKQIREHSGSCRLPPCGIEKNHAGVADCRQEDTSIDRRTVLAGVGAVVLALPLAVEAQQAAKVPRTAFLNLGSPPASDARPVGPLIERLRERGYEEGRNIAIEYRWAEGKIDRLPDLAAELVGLPVDIIISGDTDAILAVRRLSQTIPVVMTLIADPVGSGLVASLVRPGGNTTGLTVMASELAGKRLELLRVIVPRATSMAVLAHRDHRPTAQFIRETEVAARAERAAADRPGSGSRRVRERLREHGQSACRGRHHSEYLLVQLPTHAPAR